MADSATHLVCHEHGKDWNTIKAAISKKHDNSEVYRGIILNKIYATNDLTDWKKKFSAASGVKSGKVV